MSKSLNSNLHKAKEAKNDEFYTQLTDVSKELMHYKEHFKDKIVLCNCDDPTWSAFWKYFHLNFKVLGLKKLISTHYDKNVPTYKMEYAGGDDNDIEAGVKTPLEGNGDFRNEECIELLKEADIVVTNPPFSLFREYMACLVEYDKKFLIISNKGAISYRDIFPLIRDGKIWTGCKPMGGSLWFTTPEGFVNKSDKVVDGVKLTEVPCCWLTNLPVAKHEELLPLWKKYDDDEYYHYDNYDAINVDNVSQIPKDYDGTMGVPITFIDKFNPKQFEIIGIASGDAGQALGVSADFTDEMCEQYRKRNKGFRKGSVCYTDKDGNLVVPYSRMLIRKKAGA